MKYKRIFLKAAAVMTAFSVVLSSEGAAFGTVYAAASATHDTAESIGKIPPEVPGGG